MTQLAPVSCRNSTNFFVIFCLFLFVASIGIVIVSLSFWPSYERSPMRVSGIYLQNLDGSLLPNHQSVHQITQDIENLVFSNSKAERENLATSRIRYVTTIKPRKNKSVNSDTNTQQNTTKQLVNVSADKTRFKITLMPRKPKIQISEEISTENLVILASNNSSTFDFLIPK